MQSIFESHGISIQLQPQDDDDDPEWQPDDDDDDEAYEDEDEEIEVDRSAFPMNDTPNETGIHLMDSGDFGRVGVKRDNRGFVYAQRSVARRILDESSLRRATLFREDYTSSLVPNTNGTAVAVYHANVYSGQFSADSSFYYTCAQDFGLRVYDMTAPPVDHRRPENQQMDNGSRSTLKMLKMINGISGRWTITDANLSPDNTRMIYSSITSTVYMTSVLDNSKNQTPIRFGGSRHDPYMGGMGIWSCRFSADGNEIVAGGSGQIMVYDLLADRKTVEIDAHSDDVNSCCWADTASGNVLVSASDDTFIKVWDRRSLGHSARPSGVLIGHTEGITNVSAKGDGRYIISNGKDQAMRLWDLRCMRSSDEFETIKNRRYGIKNFDYRYPAYPKTNRLAHPKDCSVMTYRGHAVLRTLIRCHFSPMETTGASYLYSGSADGRVHIWSLDGRVVQVLDRSRTLPMTFDPTEREPDAALANPRRNVCVRDVSWSSQEPLLMSAGWEGGSRTGSVVAAHHWKGLNRRPGALEDYVERQRQESADVVTGSGGRSASRRFRIPGSYGIDSEDDVEVENDDEDEDWVDQI
ncbi:WD40-repeat-containing domain protein [Pterulicium gracile]|uniref:WD40-repeat-containing domain protein n=1 Tax=Pterulicium gracile TaxID=1884261 RepID=A0A5C3QMT8_9AGAR|nr:WD40-repeat-containing domain protein [Pterula gracilis]